MRRFRPAAAPALLTAGLVAGGLTGCAADNAAALRGDLFRTQDELARTRIELRDAEADLAAAERSAEALRDRLEVDGAVVAEAPEQTRAMGRITQLTVSRMLTGGLDRDGEPGDELLAVVLAPADAAGAAVKASGAVTLELVDLSAPHGDRQVAKWTFDAAEAAEKWRSTAIGAGYRFRLPLGPRPRGEAGREELHLLARFECSDGRQFDVSHALHVNRRRTEVGAATLDLPPAPAPFPNDPPPAEPTPAPPADDFPPVPPEVPEELEADDPFAPQPFPVGPPPAENPTDDAPTQTAEAPATNLGPGVEDPFAEF